MDLIDIFSTFHFPLDNLEVHAYNMRYDFNGFHCLSRHVY
jgi:hypothetical protein